MNKDIHEVQATILKELLLNNGANFASLNQLGLSNDHFTFHIKKLVEDGLVEKKDKLYFLTQKGKEISSKLDIEFLKFERQGGPSVIVTTKKEIDGKTHYLVHKRLKEPFYEYYGFVNGKIRFGEKTIDAAEREFLEETGLSGEPRMLGIYHRITGPDENNIKLDNFFFLYLINNPTGEMYNTREGQNFWKTAEEIKKLKLIPGVEEAVETVMSEEYMPYHEQFIELEEI